MDGTLCGNGDIAQGMSRLKNRMPPHGEHHRQHQFSNFLDAGIRNVGCLRFSQSPRRNEDSLFPASFFSFRSCRLVCDIILGLSFFLDSLRFRKMTGTMNGAAKSRDHDDPTEQTPLLLQGSGVRDGQIPELTPTASLVVHADRGIKDIAEEEDALENGSQTDGEVHGGGHGILVKVLSVLMIGSSLENHPCLTITNSESQEYSSLKSTALSFSPHILSLPPSSTT